MGIFVCLYKQWFLTVLKNCETILEPILSSYGLDHTSENLLKFLNLT